MDDISITCCMRILFNTGRVKTFKVLGADEVDQISRHDKLDCAYIVNTLPRAGHKYVGHWYAIYVFRRYRPYLEASRVAAELFCPLEESNYNLKIPFTVYNTNTWKIQDDSSRYCALYCLFYLWKRSLGYSLQHVLLFFNLKNLKANDAIVYRFYKSINIKNLRQSKILRCCQSIW